MMRLHRLLLVWLLPLVAAGVQAHDPDKPNRHADRYEHYEGTQTCLECHEKEAETFFSSRHYQWRGGATDPDQARALRDAQIGKLTTINDFCTGAGYQWIGEVVNDQGKVLARGCSACHSGLGKKPGTEPTREQLENMDCLMCHASGYRRSLYKDEQGDWEWRPILHENQEGLDIVSKRITLPDRAICLRCHAASGGGSNFKRGDIEYILKEPDFEHDVHMAPRKEGGQDMWCIDCHTDDKHTHRMIGRGVDLGANDRPDKTLDCSGQCHQDFVHTADADLDKHGRLTCPTCHIPTFARDQATDMFRDWSNVHFDADKGKYMYEQVLEYDVEPVYAWYNGGRYAQSPGKAVRYDARGRVTMVVPEGNRDDPAARIAPFKLHRGRMPVLKQQQWIAPLTTEELYVHGNPDQAVLNGVRQWYGLDIDVGDFAWQPTIRYLGIYHAVPPAEDALTCADCHSEGGRMNWQELGYDADPRPLSTAEREDR